MSLLRIDCPDCEAQYARHSKEFTESLGYCHQLHCLRCGKAVFEHVGALIHDGTFTVKESDDAAAWAALNAYSTPTSATEVEPPSTPADIFSTAKTVAERIVAADQASRGTTKEESG